MCHLGLSGKGPGSSWSLATDEVNGGHGDRVDERVFQLEGDEFKERSAKCGSCPCHWPETFRVKK
jgi:hypothetical protein